MNLLQRWSPAPSFRNGCLESLVLFLAQEVPHLDDHLVAYPSVELLASPPCLLIHAEVGTSQQQVQPHPGAEWCSHA